MMKVDEAREEAVRIAREFTTSVGIPHAEVPDSPELLVMTGHQPELYHPGIWVKDFLLQRLADETGAAAIDVVVDSDGFDVLQRCAAQRFEQRLPHRKIFFQVTDVQHIRGH